jgi:hypothetical protein
MGWVVQSIVFWGDFSVDWLNKSKIDGFVDVDC